MIDLDQETILLILEIEDEEDDLLISLEEEREDLPEFLLRTKFM